MARCRRSRSAFGSSSRISQRAAICSRRSMAAVISSRRASIFGIGRRIPIFVAGPLVAARTLRLVPVLVARGTDAARLERVPEVQATAGPEILRARLPPALRAPDPRTAAILILPIADLRRDDRQRRLALQHL